MMLHKVTSAVNFSLFFPGMPVGLAGERIGGFTPFPGLSPSLFQQKLSRDACFPVKGDMLEGYAMLILHLCRRYSILEGKRKGLAFRP